MFAEAGAQHHSPHFHAYYQNHVAIYRIDTIDLISGSLPRKQQRLVEAWAGATSGRTYGKLGKIAIWSISI
jgi:hypothetical protein